MLFRSNEDGDLFGEAALWSDIVFWQDSGHKGPLGIDPIADEKQAFRFPLPRISFPQPGAGPASDGTTRFSVVSQFPSRDRHSCLSSWGYRLDLYLRAETMPSRQTETRPDSQRNVIDLILMVQ